MGGCSAGAVVTFRGQLPQCGQGSVTDHAKCLWRERTYVDQTLVRRMHICNVGHSTLT
jgi:hypothetical protein